MTRVFKRAENLSWLQEKWQAGARCRRVCKIAGEYLAARDEGRRDFAHAVGRCIDYYPS
jgi:hypothetical protein